MTSPDLIDELRSSRPAAPAALRMRVRETAARAHSAPPVRERLRLSLRRVSLVAVPAALGLALVGAGAIGLSRSGPGDTLAHREKLGSSGAESAPSLGLAGTRTQAPGVVAPGAPGVSTDRAQRVGATLTVEVSDVDAVSRAAQSALALTRRLGGYVVSSSVQTGEEGSAQLVVRVPVAKVQDAIVGFSGLGRIVSQQVTVEDLHEQLDVLAQREASLSARIARIRARLASGTLDPQTEAILRVRLGTLRAELAQVRREHAATSAEAQTATISLTLATPGTLAAVPAPSRLDRALDEAVNVLVWEGVVALAVAIVLAPLALVALVAWIAHRLYRRREEERLLASS